MCIRNMVPLGVLISRNKIGYIAAALLQLPFVCSTTNTGNIINLLKVVSISWAELFLIRTQMFRFRNHHRFSFKLVSVLVSSNIVRQTNSRILKLLLICYTIMAATNIYFFLYLSWLIISVYKMSKVTFFKLLVLLDQQSKPQKIFN